MWFFSAQLEKKEQMMMLQPKCEREFSHPVHALCTQNLISHVCEEHTDCVHQLQQPCVDHNLLVFLDVPCHLKTHQKLVFDTTHFGLMVRCESVPAFTARVCPLWDRCPLRDRKCLPFLVANRNRAQTWNSASSFQTMVVSTLF